jgi:hypothetical protein
VGSSVIGPSHLARSDASVASVPSKKPLPKSGPDVLTIKQTQALELFSGSFMFSAHCAAGITWHKTCACRNRA